MYAKYCNVPKEEIDICPSIGWIADFADPQTVLNITFNGKLIVPTGNVNWGQANDPEINKAMDEAESVNGKARARRLGAKSTRNSSKKPSRFRSTGTSRATSRAKRFTA